MTRQAEHNAKRQAEGYRKRQFLLTPETLAALRDLRTRGAVSDAAAVNAAVVFYAEWHTAAISDAADLVRDATKGESK